MKKEKEMIEGEVQEKPIEKKDETVAIKKGGVIKYRKKSETEKYIKDGWVIV